MRQAPIDEPIRMRSRGAREPVTEHPLVERAEHKALGTAGRGGHHGDILRAQSVRADLGEGQRAGVKSQCAHRSSKLTQS